MTQTLYDTNSIACSKKTTENYSTSFSLGIRSLDNKYHDAIYAIYGYVRFADEIVDTHHGFPRKELIDKFEEDTYEAISMGLSTNPILHSFQWAVNLYHIPHHLINSFLLSMKMDLDKTSFDREEYDTYIYGSAEVVGLMCLLVFLNGDEKRYNELKFSAGKLGQAFQKVNFLRDMASDYFERGRVYFPDVEFHKFGETEKSVIISEIESDFTEAYKGIQKLPTSARFGVYMAYIYYLQLLGKIKKTPAPVLVRKRIRVNNWYKLMLMFRAVMQQTLFSF